MMPPCDKGGCDGVTIQQFSAKYKPCCLILELHNKLWAEAQVILELPERDVAHE